MLVGANRPPDRAAASRPGPSPRRTGSRPPCPLPARGVHALVRGAGGAIRHRRIFSTASAGSGFTTTRSAVYPLGSPVVTIERGRNGLMGESLRTAGGTFSLEERRVGPGSVLDGAGAAYLARTVAEGAELCSGWILTALASSAVEARILLRTPAGHMRPVGRAGDGALLGRKRSARRREVLRKGVARRLALP